ncbi:MAG: hypothetical protein GX767_03540 [Firmicutes bacterium]|nr:hypothetical protein [Bacillota bacterium]
MVLYTPIPLEEIFYDSSEEKKTAAYIQLPYSRGTIEVELLSVSTAKIVRLISSDLSDYLHPQLQPGNTIKLKWELEQL